VINKKDLYSKVMSPAVIIGRGNKKDLYSKVMSADREHRESDVAPNSKVLLCATKILDKTKMKVGLLKQMSWASDCVCYDWLCIFRGEGVWGSILAVVLCIVVLALIVADTLFLVVLSHRIFLLSILKRQLKIGKQPLYSYSEYVGI
jgi:hypothetical protein